MGLPGELVLSCPLSALMDLDSIPGSASAPIAIARSIDLDRFFDLPNLEKY